MRALVVGGGVAGPACALALQQVGVEAVVLERRPASDPDEGSYLTVAPNGLAALDVLGVLEAVRERRCPEPEQPDGHLVRPAARRPLARTSAGRRHRRPDAQAVRAGRRARPRGGRPRRAGAVRGAGRVGGRRGGRGGARGRRAARGRRGRRCRRRALAGAPGRRPRGAGRPVRRPRQLRRHHPRDAAGRRPARRGLALRLRATGVLRRAPHAVGRRRVVRQRPARGDRARRARPHLGPAVAGPAGRPAAGGRRPGRRAGAHRPARARGRQHARPRPRADLAPRSRRPRGRRRARSLAQLRPGRLARARGRRGAGRLRCATTASPPPPSPPTRRPGGPGSSASSGRVRGRAAPRSRAGWGRRSATPACGSRSAGSSPTAAPRG